MHSRSAGGGKAPHESGTVVRAVVRRRGRRWTATVCYAVDMAKNDASGVVGIDCNVRQMTTHTGERFEMPDISRPEARYRRCQRRMARQRGPVKRKRRASARWRRTAAKAAKCARKAANIRKDWRHRTTTDLCQRYGTVVLEDLGVTQMTASARGTVEAPGRNVRQKAGLNRVILGTGRAELRRMFEYKAGKTIVVDPAYTSQTCARGDHIDNLPRTAH